jgi:hypothetical protein
LACRPATTCEWDPNFGQEGRAAFERELENERETRRDRELILPHFFSFSFSFQSLVVRHLRSVPGEPNEPARSINAASSTLVLLALAVGPLIPLLLLLPQGFAFQCLAGRLGLVTGQDLAQHCGKRYPWGARVLLWLLLEVAIVGEPPNTAHSRQRKLQPGPAHPRHFACLPLIVGADIQETIGSAIAISILTGGAIPLWLGCIFISITAFLLLMLDRFGYRCAPCLGKDGKL